MKFLLVVFLLPLQLFAQDITGVWTGTLYNDTTKRYIKYELAISEYDGKLSGYSHTIFLIDGFENTGLKSIKVRKVEEFLVEDDKLIYNNYTEPPAKGVKTFSELVLSQNDTAMILSGHWNTNRTKVYEKLTGNIFLEKKKKIKETLIIEELENFGLAGSLSFMVSPVQPGDTVLVNKPAFNAEEFKSQHVNTDVVSNISIPANTGIQQAGKPISEAGFNKDDTIKEKFQLKSFQLPVADKIKQKKEVIGAVQLSKIPVKSRALQIGNQQETVTNIQEKVLNREDSVLNKDLIKQEPSLLAEISASKKVPSNIVSAKQRVQKTTKQQEAGIETPDKGLNKSDSGLNKEVRGMPLVVTGMPTPKNESPNIISVKPATQQIEKQQGAGKEIPGMVLNKNNGEGGNAGIKMVSQAAAEIATRKIEAIKSVEIKSDSLLLTLYDNGEIDGDTVSVLLNGKVIMPMEGLSLKAINKTIYLTPEMGDSIVLIMYAENLGSIPPNTGLLVIHDGEDIYEIRFTGDLEKNSSIILKRKKKLIQ